MGVSWRVVEGDCRESLAGLEAGSVDAVVTDPPYGLAFMGKRWDQPGALVEREPDRSVSFDRIGGNHNPVDAADAARTRGVQNRRSQEWHEAWAREALRVLKPGGYLLAFGGTRTYHRLACAIEDAGFEIRDTICWLYGQGFPKSLNAGCRCEREPASEHDLRSVLGPDLPAPVDPAAERREVLFAGVPESSAPANGSMSTARSDGVTQRLVEGRSDVLAEGGQLSADQVRSRAVVGEADGPEGRLRDGAPAADGAAGRAAADEDGSGASPRPRSAEQRAGESRTVADERRAQDGGGWPLCPRCGLPAAGLGTALKPAHEPIVVARKPLIGTVAQNVLAHGVGALNVDGCRVGAGEGGDREGEPSAERRYANNGSTNFAPTPGPRGGAEDGRWPANVVLDEDAAAMLDAQAPDTGGGGFCGGRAFSGELYGAAARADPTRQTGRIDANGGASRFFYCAKASSAERNAGLDDGRNTHPTVKPIDLMRWLVRLVTPPGGLVLDPFTGSGTTGIAALREGFSFVGIERESEYCRIARARIIGDAPLLNSVSEVAA